MVVERSETVNGCNAERLGTFEPERINALGRIMGNVHDSKLKDQLYLLKLKILLFYRINFTLNP
jgi:hypothetical protein